MTQLVLSCQDKIEHLYTFFMNRPAKADNSQILYCKAASGPEMNYTTKVSLEKPG
jgi:hypothetical protein